MKQQIQNDIPYFTFDSFPSSLPHAVLTRQGGVSQAPFASLNMSSAVQDNAGNLAENRRRGFGIFERDVESLAHAHLIHAAGVARVTAADYGKLAGQVDGLISNEAGCGLTMNFADCAPILLYDPRQQAIGLGHAGWRGALVDLPGALLRAMMAAFGSRPEDIIAGIGPCIGPCCYQVGQAVIGEVQKRFGEASGLLIPRHNGHRPHFDLPETNRRNLQGAGVRHIELAGLCTACRTDLFFSHRAEKGKTGRFGVMLLLS